MTTVSTPANTIDPSMTIPSIISTDEQTIRSKYFPLYHPSHALFLASERALSEKRKSEREKHETKPKVET